MESLLLKLRNTLNKAFWVIVKITVSPYTRGCFKLQCSKKQIILIKQV